MIDRAERGDRAVILHPEFRLTGPDALDEFQELARSAGAEVVRRLARARRAPLSCLRALSAASVGSVFKGGRS